MILYVLLIRHQFLCSFRSLSLILSFSQQSRHNADDRKHVTLFMSNQFKSLMVLLLASFAIWLWVCVCLCVVLCVFFIFCVCTFSQKVGCRLSKGLLQLSSIQSNSLVSIRKHCYEDSLAWLLFSWCDEINGTQYDRILNGFFYRKFILFSE